MPLIDTMSKKLEIAAKKDFLGIPSTLEKSNDLVSCENVVPMIDIFFSTHHKMAQKLITYRPRL